MGEPAKSLRVLLTHAGDEACRPPVPRVGMNFVVGRRAVIAVLLSAGLFVQPDLLGCSPVMGYVRPTNFELVKGADAVVLARAESFEKKGKMENGKEYGVFKFRILETLKGDHTGEFLTAEGDTAIRPWGDPDDFSYSKPDHGPCHASDYELRSDYVLFLEKWQGQWLVGGPPFTRVNVKVTGTNASWTKAVRQYVRIAALNDYEREKVALRALRSRALARDLGCPAELEKDIEAHFKKPTPAKSFADLLSLYNQTNDPDTRELVLWACARGEKLEAKGLFRQLLRSGEWKRHVEPVCSFFIAVKFTGFHDTIADELSNNQKDYERRLLLYALAATSGSGQQARMQRVLESVSNREAEILGEWFVNHPSPEAICHYTSLAATNYAEECELTFTLAGMGDTNVVNWARDFAKQRSEKAWVAYYTFARSPLPIADTLVREAIQRGDSEGLVWLVQGYQDSHRSDRLDRLREIVALKSKSNKLIYWLRRTVGNMAYRGDKAAELLLGQLPVVEAE